MWAFGDIPLCTHIICRLLDMHHQLRLFILLRAVSLSRYLLRRIVANIVYVYLLSLLGGEERFQSTLMCGGVGH